MGGSPKGDKKHGGDHSSSSPPVSPQDPMRPRSSPTRSNRTTFGGMSGHGNISPTDSINTPLPDASGYFNNNNARSSQSHFKLSFEESTNAMNIISSLEKQFHDFFAVRNSSSIPQSNHEHLLQNHRNSNNNHPNINTPTTIIRSQISLTVTVMGSWEQEIKTNTSPLATSAHAPELAMTNPDAAGVANPDATQGMIRIMDGWMDG